ncbi:MAG: xylulokinase [Saccharospirillum sp.]|nr:xylulokinase [Saccharospirillum sp.]
MYLGLDLGTSSLKAVLIDAQGHVLCSASVPLTTQQPRPLWSEQHTAPWWQALLTAVADLTQRHDLQQLKAIGLSGHMHGAVLLDSNYKVLRPCILWNDGRSSAECAELEAALPDVRERSGNLAMPGFTAPKLLWVKHHEPDLFAQVSTVLLPKDYLRLLLTGTLVSEMSDAAGTLWLNPALRDWDDQLLAASGLNRAQMPTLIEGSQSSGTLTAEAAKALGLPRVPVAGGAGDNAAGAIGVGVTEPGQGFISLGTSGVYFAVSAAHHAEPEQTVHAFCHCLPKRWHQMSVTLGAASSLEWFSGITGQSVSVLLQELDDSGLTETEVTFLPYLSGERTPHNNPYLTGQFFGLTHRSGRPAMTLAILEGVAFSMADGEDALTAAGTALNDISLIGGGARSSRWRQLLADVLRRPLHFREGGEVGPGLGAARLAALMVEGDSAEQIARLCPPPPIIESHTPDPERANYFQQQLARYRALYQQTRVLSCPESPE